MVQVNAVEERTDVERDGTLELCAGERGLQGRHVALDDGGVEAEVGGAEEEIVGAQLATQGGQGLGEGVARVLSVAFGPKEGEQAIAAHTALSPRRKYGEQGQLAALRRRPGDRTALGSERGPAGPGAQSWAELRVSAVVAGTRSSLLVVRVTASDTPTPLAFNLSVQNGVAQGTIRLPPGMRRMITVDAYDTDGDITAE